MITDRVEIMFISHRKLKFCLYRCNRKKTDADSSQGGTISSKKMKPADPIAQTPFDDLTNIQMSGIIDCFL
jgi:hypothetical protein